MRVFFVSGTAIGGAARSTHELAALLASRGHAVTTIMRDESRPRLTELHRRALNLRVKLGSRPPVALVDAIVRRLGRATAPDPHGAGHRALLAVRPENAVVALIERERPDVVVANSIDLPAWRQLLADARARALPAVLYVREETGLLHISHSKAPPDLLLVNAEGHGHVARQLGVDAVLVPSVVECAKCAVEPDRRAVLFVNPIPMQGLDIAIALAASRPDVPFVFAESWPLDDDAWRELRATAARVPNIELRPYDPDPKRLFRDARVLLAPYRYPGRSRVIAEAQCSGIPVLASDRYGPAEAVGPGGALCDPDGPPESWTAALGRLWDDPAEYERASRAARQHAGRPEMRPEAIAATLEEALEGLLAATPTRMAG